MAPSEGSPAVAVRKWIHLWGIRNKNQLLMAHENGLGYVFIGMWISWALRMCLPQVFVKGTGRKMLQTSVITRKSGLKTLARSVGCKSRPSIARQVMRDRVIREKVLEILTKDIQKEMTTMCAKKTSSVLCNPSPEAVKTFSWEAVVSKVQAYAPTLFQFLKGTVHVKRHVSRKQKAALEKGSRKQKHKTNRPSEVAIIGVCAAVLLRNRNLHMKLLQKMVSLILNGGHASKQVCVHCLNMTLAL